MCHWVQGQLWQVLQSGWQRVRKSATFVESVDCDTPAPSTKFVAWFPLALFLSTDARPPSLQVHKCNQFSLARNETYNAAYVRHIEASRFVTRWIWHDLVITLARCHSASRGAGASCVSAE